MKTTSNYVGHIFMTSDQLLIDASLPTAGRFQSVSGIVLVLTRLSLAAVSLVSGHGLMIMIRIIGKIT